MKSATSAEACRQLLELFVHNLDSPPISPIAPASIPLPEPTAQEIEDLVEGPEKLETLKGACELERVRNGIDEARELALMVEFYLGEVVL